MTDTTMEAREKQCREAVEECLAEYGCVLTGECTVGPFGVRHRNAIIAKERLQDDVSASPAASPES